MHTTGTDVHMHVHMGSHACGYRAGRRHIQWRRSKAVPQRVCTYICMSRWHPSRKLFFLAEREYHCSRLGFLEITDHPSACVRVLPVYTAPKCFTEINNLVELINSDGDLRKRCWVLPLHSLLGPKYVPAYECVRACMQARGGACAATHLLPFHGTLLTARASRVCVCVCVCACVPVSVRCVCVCVCAG